MVLQLAATPVRARLSETVAQSQARYGAPTPELILPDEKPLVEGVKDSAYRFSGWRIRVAFINGTAARIEYAHLPVGGTLKAITDTEVAAILDAENAGQRWREPKKHSTGDVGKDIGAAIASALAPKIWERPDHATATLMLGNLILRLELPAAAEFEKNHPAAAKAGVPKF